MSQELDTDRARGERFERALFWRELLIVAVVAGVLVLRGLVG